MNDKKNRRIEERRDIKKQQKPTETPKMKRSN